MAMVSLYSQKFVPVSVCVSVSVYWMSCVCVCYVFIKRQSTSHGEGMRHFTEILNKLLQRIRSLTPTNPN